MLNNELSTNHQDKKNVLDSVSIGFKQNSQQRASNQQNINNIKKISQPQAESDNFQTQEEPTGLTIQQKIRKQLHQIQKIQQLQSLEEQANQPPINSTYQSARNIQACTKPYNQKLGNVKADLCTQQNKQIKITDNTLQNIKGNSHKISSVQPSVKRKSTNLKRQLGQILSQNKYLKLIFKHFCNVSFGQINKKTFQEMSDKNDYLSLNKFMLFCKEYNLQSFVKPKYLKVLNQEKAFIKIPRNQNNSQMLDASKASLYKSPVSLRSKNVNEIDTFQNLMLQLYKSCIKTADKMTSEEFQNAISRIYTVFQMTEKQVNQNQSQEKIKEKYLTEVLAIKNHQKYKQKMKSWKIYSQSSKQIVSQQKDIIKPLKNSQRKLVLHGGRHTTQIREQLQKNKRIKIQKAQKWIKKQTQQSGIYSKSRLFYHPNASTTYQPNDVIRLARSQTENQNPNIVKNTQGVKLKRQIVSNVSNVSWLNSKTNPIKLFTPKDGYNKKTKIVKSDNITTFGTIFKEKTNIIQQKKSKIQSNVSSHFKTIKKLNITQNDDDILNEFFQNQKRIYGIQQH